jgi:lipopolysaccharide biosynthesis glycosyltransferase
MKFQPQEWLKAVRDTKHWILWIFHRKYFKNLIERNKLQNSYFNSGMMLMNLEALRKADMQAKWENLIDNPLPFSLFNDQDILNYTCAGHVQLLDLKWNYFSFLKHASDVSPVLLHYAGPRKPWKSVKVKQYSYWKKYADLSGLIDKTK